MSEAPTFDELPDGARLGSLVEPGRRGTATLRSNSLARLAADGSQLAFSLLAGTITARVLGPAGKGFYSSLVLLVGLFAHVFNAGLGEATIVFANQRRADLQTIVSSTLAALALFAVVGCVLLYAVGTLALHPSTGNQRLALALGCLTLVVNTFGVVTSSVLIAQERVIPVGVLGIVSAAISTIALWPLLVVFRTDAAGAVVASMLGVLVALVATAILLERGSIRVRLGWNSAYLVKAMRFGAVVQCANVLMLMTGRLDLLLVYHISGASAAGNYSIALTVGALASSVPFALSYAAFPRMAHLPEEEARSLIGQVTRIGFAGAILSGAGLALITPMAIPFVFGSVYRPAVGPTLLLIVGAILGSGQWLLSRSATARGLPRVVVTSYAASVVVMVGLDLMLIPPFGIVGAAWAALLSQLVGMVVASIFYVCWHWDMGAFIPRFRDVVYLFENVRQMLRPGRIAQLAQDERRGGSTGTASSSPFRNAD